MQDELNRRTRVIEAFGEPAASGLERTTTTVYDAADNVLRVQAPENRTVSFAYDKLNRVSRRDDGSGSANQRKTGVRAVFRCEQEVPGTEP